MPNILLSCLTRPCQLLGVALFALLISYSARTDTDAATDQRAVEAVIHDYLEGTSFNRVDQIKRAFHPDARLYLDNGTGGMREVLFADYAKGFAKNPGQFNGRFGRLLSTQIDGGIASAKAEVLVGARQARFVDLFLLKKIDRQWQIISKTAASEPAVVHGRKVVLVVSNVHTMPGTELNAGNSFGELLHAYSGFRAAGYGVQFVSPDGGAVPLAYIDFTDAEHRANFYDADFMWGLAHTRKPEDVLASDYAALMYIGGSAAMYGVAEHLGMQALAMRIYEKQSGIVAAVCHGSAGLVDLKLTNGSALVSGKRVTGYPDAFEDMDAAYYKTFPFSIEQRLRESRGRFSSGARGRAHVEVDGRLITGMNWESSRGVVDAIVQSLQAKADAAKVSSTSSTN